jgi:endonuclease/exonuclease/phosphatase family metal-dependent hydrolase
VFRCAFPLALLVCLLPGCDSTPPVREAAAEPPPPGATEDESFLGKADGGCGIEGTAAEAGVLELVNDASIDAALLDAPISEGGAGLYRPAAYNLVDARPIEDLAALDAVPWVGRATCEALADFACNVERRCKREFATMTWNLRQFPLTAATEDAVVQVLREMEPDLVGLQEIEDLDAFERLLERMPEYEGALAEPGPYTRVAALWRPDAVSVGRIEDRFVDDWYAFPRPMLTLDAIPHGAVEAQAVTFGVVHLKASGGDRNEDRRRSAVGKLRDWIDTRRAEQQPNVIVVGDFNDELLDPSRDNVYGELTDPNAHAKFLTEPLEREGALTYVPWERMLDHVLVTDELYLDHESTEVLALDETWRDDYVDVVSDHRPVLSTFSVVVRH